MAREHFVEFVRSAEQGVVATVDVHGDPEAALVGLAVSDAAEVIFDSLADTRKIRNIRAHPRAALVVGWDDGLSVQVEGTAHILAGAERDRYGQIYVAQFPGARALDHITVKLILLYLRLNSAASGPGASTSGRRSSRARSWHLRW